MTVHRDSDPWYNNSNSPMNKRRAKIDALVNKFEDQASSARTANLERYNQAMDIYSNIEKMYAPGGQLETRGMEMIESQRNKDLAYSAQSGVSSGLSQTTRQQYASKRWTEDVGAPALQDLQYKSQASLAGAMGQRAGFIERREDEYPDYGMIAQLTSQM